MLEVDRSHESTNTLSAMVAAAYLATLPLLMGWFLPFAVAGFSTTMGFTEQQSGLLVSADMLGYTVGTLVTSPLLDRIDWRRACGLLLIVVTLTNLLACAMTGINGLLTVRVCAGLASGALAAFALGACAQSDDPGSTYGLWQTFQAIAAALAGITLPGLIESWTARVVFVLIAILAVAGLLLVQFIPRRPIQSEVVSNSARPVNSRLFKIAMAVFAVLLLLGATTAVTAFVERIGTQMHVTPQSIGYALSAAGLASLAGGLLAAKLGDRWGYIGPTSAGSALAALAYLTYAIAPSSAATMVAGTVLYFGAYSFVAAYFMGTLALADSSSRAVAIGNGALGAGLTLGPILGAAILSWTGSTDILCYTAAAMTLLGLLLIMPVQFSIRIASRQASSQRVAS